MTDQSTCPNCGSQLVLVADQDTMLGTLECPECCCDTEPECKEGEELEHAE